MFRQLEQRFTRYSMLVLSLTLLIGFGVLFGFLWQDTMNGIGMQLDRTANGSKGDYQGNPPDGKRFPEDAAKKSPPLGLTIEYQPLTGEISRVWSPFYENYLEEEALLTAAREQGKNRGTILTDDARWAYKIEERSGQGSKASFLEVSGQYQFLQTLFITLLGGYLLLILVFWRISKGFAKRAVAPAQEAYEKQTNFLADVSHELKTPLAVIQTNADLVLLHQEETVQSQQRWLSNIQHETKHMDGLISSLLAVSLGGDEAAVWEPVNWTEIVERCLLSFEPSVYEKDIVLERHLETVEVQGNPSDFHRMIYVLMDNAVKYTPEKGRIVVALKAHRGTAQLIVRNSGDLVPEEEQALLFDRFYRGEKSRNRALGGFGLGLSIVSQLVQRYKGESLYEADGDNVFTLTLPLK